MLYKNVESCFHQSAMCAFRFFGSIMSYVSNELLDLLDLYCVCQYTSFLILKNKLITNTITNKNKAKHTKLKNNKDNKLKFQTENKDSDVSIPVEVLNRTDNSYVYKLKTKMFEYLYIVSSLVLVSGNKNVSIYSWQKDI